MSVVIHRVDTPGLAGLVMDDPVPDTVKRGIPHVHVRRGHINLCTQYSRTIRKFAGPHSTEQFQVFTYSPVAEWTLPARLGQGAAVLAGLLGRKIAYISLAGLDQFNSKGIELLEIVGGIEKPVVPVISQPADILLDGLYVLDVLLVGIGVIEAQVAGSVIVPGNTEIQAYRLGMPDVQVAVRLGWKACCHPPLVLAAADIAVDDIAYKV